MEQVVLWSRGVTPNWWFLAAKSEREDINGLPVYETLDAIIHAGEYQRLRVCAEELRLRLQRAGLWDEACQKAWNQALPYSFPITEQQGHDRE